MSRPKTFRKGAKIRYIGEDERLRELWGNYVYRVENKEGNIVRVCFPTRYLDGSVHLMMMAMPISDLEIVTD